MAMNGTNYSNLAGYRWPRCECGHSRRWHGPVRALGRCRHCPCELFREESRWAANALRPCDRHHPFLNKTCFWCHYPGD